MAEDRDFQPEGEGGANQDAGTRSQSDDPYSPPSQIGPYRIVRKLGEGGMGEVYLAEQTDPIQRLVAVKVIKLGMSTRQVVARFESERQAMALMDHPGIARIFDAGTVGERPYFVMEYVEGTPVTTYCNENRLSLAERLELFIRICDAVQHAHQKAVIHRDLKPTNVLVTVRDGQPVPKVIDFGVAKAIGRRLTELTMHTELGQLLGTPRYMSPEQLDLTSPDVDTRSDVYSLGVLLYEILTGVVPFEDDSRRTKNLAELLRQLREREPERPSARLTTQGEVARQIAAERGTSPSTLIRQLQGDLDWIVLKALEQERERRYGSAAELAADLRRFQRSELIEARPPDLWYRTTKFVRKHRAGVASVAAVFLLLAAFSVVMSFQADRLARERDRANREAESARQVSRFLTELFKVPDPYVSQGVTPSAREILDRGAREIEFELADQPLVRARLQRTMGQAYENLGLYADAEELFLSAHDVLKREAGEHAPETVTAFADLASLYYRQGRYEQAEAALTQSIEQKRQVLGEDDPATLNGIANLANLHQALGRFDEAEKLYLDLLERRRRSQGSDHPETLGIQNNLAALYAKMGRSEESLALIRDTYETRIRIQGPNHPETLGAAANLAEQLRDSGRFQEGTELELTTLEARQRILGEQHPDTLTSHHNLGIAYLDAGRHQLAEEHLLKSYQGRRESLGEDHPDTLLAAYNLGTLYSAMGRLRDAQARLEEATDGWVQGLGAAHPNVQRARGMLATIHYQQKDYARSEALFREVLEVRVGLGESHPALHETLFNLACVTALQGKRDQAVAFLQRAVAGGFRGTEILTDPDLASLHPLPEFQSLTQLASANVP